MEVNGNSRKSSIEANVYLQRWESGRWGQRGSRGYGYLANTYGSAGVKKGSEPICGGQGSYWRTLAQVRISGGTWWNVWSASAQDPYGC